MICAALEAEYLFAQDFYRKILYAIFLAFIVNCYFFPLFLFFSASQEYEKDDRSNH